MRLYAENLGCVGKISNEPSAFEVLGDCFEDRALGLGYRLSP